MAEALDAAHEAGVIHLDLKPPNIRVRDDGMAKVIPTATRVPSGERAARHPPRQGPRPSAARPWGRAS